MKIYSVVNVENPKTYETSLLDQEEEHALPYMEGLALGAPVYLKKDIVL